MPNLRKSLGITFLASNGATVINFLVTIVLARLLTPAEIGVFSIAYVLVSVAHIFRDFGVTTYLVHEKDLTPEKIRSISGVLFTSSWTTAAILYSLAGLAADYYSQPGVEKVIEVLALGFVFIPFGAITHNLLTRELKAREQAIASILGVTVFASSSVLLAWLGFSYMTMAWASLLNIVATAIAYLPYRPKYAPWLPSFRGWGNVIHFSSGVLFCNTIKELNNSLPDFALGKLSGPHGVGIMSRANSTSNLFNMIAGPTVGYAVLPVLSQKHHAGEPIAEPLSKAISYLTGLTWPAVLGTAIFAEPIILFLYGEQWIESAPLVRVICAIAFINTPFTFTILALQAIGRPYLAAVPGGLQLAFSAGAILMFFDQTLASFAYAMLAANLATVPIYLWLQNRYLSFPIKLFLAAQRESIALTISIAILLVIASKLLVSFSGWLHVLIAFAMGIFLWVVLVASLSHPLFYEVKLLAKKFPLVQHFFFQRTNDSN